MSQLVLRPLLLTVVCTMAGPFVSCTTPPVGPDGNIFLHGSPRYGHGGTERSKYKYGATDGETGQPVPKPRRDTRYYSDERRGRDEDSGSNSDDRGSNDSTSDTGANQSPPDNGNTNTSDSGTSADPPADPKPKPATEDLPYATPVPGKDGFVYSPYYSAGYVDVSGMPSGSKARCPYTKKIFRVP